MPTACTESPSQELARRLVRQSWRVLAYHFGENAVTAERIAAHTTLPIEFVRAACELAGYPLRRETGDRTFTLDSARVDIADFIEVNGLTAPEQDAIWALAVGEAITYGGGAAATFVLRRET